ncbi:unnamed protein product, partial [Prunus brigantina]
MSDRKEWQHSYQPMNYNGYDSCGSNSQSIGQYYGQYNFTHQGRPNNQYGSSSQFGGQYGGHNYVGGFGEQYSGHNYIGGYDLMNQNGSNDQNGFGGQTNQVAEGQYIYPDGQNNSANIYDQRSYGSHQMNHPNGYNGQNFLNISERPYVDRTDEELQSLMKETSKVNDVFMEMADRFYVSNELLIQRLREISSRLAIGEQVLSQQAEGQTLNPNLDSQSQEENSHAVAIQPPVPLTHLKESKVDMKYKGEKEIGETTLESNVQVDTLIENLTLVEEKWSTQGDESQKVVTDENFKMVQTKATILGCNGLQFVEQKSRSMAQDAIMIDMIVGEKLDIARPQLQVVKFIEPQPKAKIGQPSGLEGHEGSAKVMVKSHSSCTSHPSTSTHCQRHGKVRFENKKGSKLGVKHVNFVGPYINQLAGIGGWNNLG